MKWIFLGVLGMILAFGLSLAFRLGVFKPVEIALSQEQELHLLYKEHMGPYHKIVPVIQEVESWAKAHQIDCSLSYGEYLDNPEQVEEVRLRSHGGCVVKSFPQDLPEGFKTEVKPPAKYIKALFAGAPSIGPFKVYSKVRELANGQRIKLGGSTLEIYEIKGEDAMLTTYLFSIVQ
jgi:hypothetical protein